MYKNESTAWAYAFDRALSSIGEERDLFAIDKQSARRIDADGQMHVARCNISKANVCGYFGCEIPQWQELGLAADKLYQLYRDPAELAKAAPSFANKQLLLKHSIVNAKNPKPDITVGVVGMDVAFDAPYLTASIAVWAQDAISLINAGELEELSPCYRYKAIMVPGVSPEGVAYDGRMVDITANHLALVEKGRTGSDVYVADSLPSEFSTMKKSAKIALAIATALGVTPTPEQVLAMDAACASTLKAMDEKDEELGEDGKPKKAGEPQRPGVAADTSTVLDVAAMDAAIVAKGYVTKDEAARMAQDAATSAVQRVNALHKAREDVKPLVGVVAMDSAEDVYKFALEHAKVALDGVPPAAFAALVEQVKARKAAPPTQTPKFATDSATSVDKAFPGLGRFASA